MIRRLHERYKLESNPFEPSASGAPLWGDLRPPHGLERRMDDLVNMYRTGTGVKGLIVVGEYGMGKTCLLNWLHNSILPTMKIRSFYFHNPGVHFYALADSLLNTIGRKNFAKFVWELASSHVSGPIQGSLFETGFDAYLGNIYTRGRQSNREEMTRLLQDAVLSAGTTDNEQIAHCLARIAIDAPRKPYFEYRDFIPRQHGNVVAEGEAAPYFRAVLRTICEGMGADAVAFLVDEFEEISLQKRLSKKAAYEYLGTLKRLINLAQSEKVDFWVVLSMTPDAYEATIELDPSLVDRFEGRELRIAPLTVKDARDLMVSRLSSARSDVLSKSTPPLYPFPERLPFRLSTFANPRKLVKVCFRALAQANEELDLPFPDSYLRQVEDELFPSMAVESGAGNE